MKVAFLIWEILGVGFIVLGMLTYKSKRQAGFWANASAPKMSDIMKYNHAVGKLWVAFGIVMMLLGFPFLMEEKSPLIFLSVIGVVIEILVIMIVYTLCIETKYRK